MAKGGCGKLCPGSLCADKEVPAHTADSAKAAAVVLAANLAKWTEDDDAA